MIIKQSTDDHQNIILIMILIPFLALSVSEYIRSSRKMHCSYSFK